MEHEVFVPVPVGRLREALDDPARVARAVPGFQHDAGAEPVAGRLKVRIGSHSITYRGAVRVSRRDDGSYAVEGEGAEVRGTGTVKLALRLTLRAAEGGATLTVHGTAAAGGRVVELPPDTVTSAVARLLNRFAANLGTETGATADTATATTPGETPGKETPAGEASAEGTSSSEEPPVPEAPPASSAPSAFDAENSLPPLGPGPQDDADETADETADEPVDGTADPAGDEDGADDSVDADEDAVAEAAHARRTMIGRSAEEVDHAPPRGRYAPVPAPQTVSAAAPLRWAVPAAALAVASAIVAVRALRRRR
ncbi:SRPBCC domain-containing protein [Streptomyces sp. KMM 9044]|uniref:SRPBCC domain-containing protein n=1 Tax=Streptomyces sp. KMM 9044 TaxID=2744474 RepID=UPI0021516C31|nr:SRPBCC domain-containing protein [Streptomyces sp. KMM 9044]WAX78951.1 SRPBCC domain-containing protein [Streptomyces sp. KMM 9044]